MEPSFMTPSTSEQVAREAEIVLLRSMSGTMETIAAELTAHRADLGTMKTDIAVIKVRQEQSAKMEDLCKDLRADIDALKARNQQQDGAMTFAGLLRDFGPWVVSLLLLAWGLFARAAPK